MGDHHQPHHAPAAARSPLTRLTTPASDDLPWTRAGLVIARHFTPIRDTWRAGAPAPGRTPCEAADLLADHGHRDGLIVVHFNGRVAILASAMAQEAGFSIETAWHVMAEMVTRGCLTPRPDRDGYDATAPGSTPLTHPAAAS